MGLERTAGDILSTGVAVTGSIFTKEPLTLAGTVSGDVTCEGKLIVTGCVAGRITAPEAEISGSVEGDISASRTLHILAFAKVKGDIETDILSADGSAVVNGHMSVGCIRAKASEERLAAFEARLRERFPSQEAAALPREENSPEERTPPEDLSDKARRQRLKNASDKLKAQKRKKQKLGADGPTIEKEYGR